MMIDGKWYSETELRAYVKDLKRLLRAAVNDFRTWSFQCGVDDTCKDCPMNTSSECKWKHEEEALKLIGRC